MWKKKSDTALLQDTIRHYSFTCTFAGLQKYRKFFLVLLVPFLICSLGSMFTNETYYNKVTSFSSVETLVPLTAVFAMVAFNLLCFKQIFHHKKLWRSLLEHLETFDFTMSMRQIVYEEVVIKYYLRFIIANVMYISMYVVLYYSVEEHFNIYSILSTSYIYFTSTQIMVTSVFLRNLFEIIHRRYESLTNEIKTMYLSDETIEPLWNEQDIKALYLILYEIGNKINSLLGLRVLLIFFITFVDILVIFQYVVLDYIVGRSRNLMFLLGQGLQTLYLLVSTFT